ncbi:MAG: polysaccharide deacetylase, partial [Halanaerobiaceae bacterium]|nr:polysaccharide deacetylase [Halanaerobiaceae bacterium]
SIGYKTIMWSADTIDWQRPAPEIIVQRAVNKIDDGGIILMHPTEPSLAALDNIIDILKQRGYKFVTVSQLIQE